jgi:hypothetical protein
MEMETKQQEDRRKFPRFSDRILAGATVNLAPCPPLFGEAASGYLIDLSAGGMAILISDLIPKNIFLKMTMTLPDGFRIESVVTVRRIIKQGHHNDFLHGMEFLNPSPEMITRIEMMAKDILACNQRTKEGSREICVSNCALTQICKRPQRIVKNVQPALIELTQELKNPSNWKPSLADIENFWNKAA